MPIYQYVTNPVKALPPKIQIPDEFYNDVDALLGKHRGSTRQRLGYAEGIRDVFILIHKYFPTAPISRTNYDLLTLDEDVEARR